MNWFFLGTNYEYDLVQQFVVSKQAWILRLLIQKYLKTRTAIKNRKVVVGNELRINGLGIS